MWNDLLYLFTADDKIYSYSLEKKGKVRYEKAFSEKLKQICKEKEEEDESLDSAIHTMGKLRFLSKKQIKRSY